MILRFLRAGPEDKRFLALMGVVGVVIFRKGAGRAMGGSFVPLFIWHGQKLARAARTSRGFRRANGCPGHPRLGNAWIDESRWLYSSGGDVQAGSGGCWRSKTRNRLAGNSYMERAEISQRGVSGKPYWGNHDVRITSAKGSRGALRKRLSAKERTG